MIEVAIGIYGVGIGLMACSLLDQKRTRASLAQSQAELSACRQTLTEASQANQSLAAELARQRDHLAAIESRLGATAPARGFQVPR